VADHQVTDLTPEEVSKGMAEGHYLLVDVREPNEVPRKPIRVPPWFRFRVSIPWIFRIPKASRWSLPAAPGKIGHGVAGRSSRRFGYDKHLAGGMLAWKAAGLPPRPAADHSMTSMNKVFADLPVTIFERCRSSRATTTPSISARVFPDDPGPEDIRRAAADAVMDGYNQYPSMMGLPELRQAISAHYGRWHALTSIR